MKIIIIVLMAVLLPEEALANSMAPIFPLISGVGWAAMPIIIGVESLYYYLKTVNNPVRLALYSNLVSALAGLVIAIITLPITLGPAVDPYLWAIYLGVVLSSLAIVFHWWLSSHIEYRFSKWHKLWKNTDLPVTVFYKANAISYGLLYLIFIALFINQLRDYYIKT